MERTSEINFSKLNGLVTAVVQDDSTSEVLMVGFMNDLAYRETVATGFVTFYSRSRQKLWVKGESSGHTLLVVSIRTDCDRDALVIRVNVNGPGVCHEGFRSCFFRQLSAGEWETKESRTFIPSEIYGGTK